MAGAGQDAPEAVNAGRARPGAAGQAQGTRQVDVPALAAHPHIRVPASVSAAEAADEVSRTMAALVTRLLTEACVVSSSSIFDELRRRAPVGQGLSLPPDDYSSAIAVAVRIVIGACAEHERGMCCPCHREADARHLRRCSAPAQGAPAVSIGRARSRGAVVPHASDRDPGSPAVILSVQPDRDARAPRFLSRRPRAVEIADVHGGRRRRDDRHYPAGETRLVGIVGNGQHDRVGAAD